MPKVLFLKHECSKYAKITKTTSEIQNQHFQCSLLPSFYLASCTNYASIFFSFSPQMKHHSPYWPKSHQTFYHYRPEFYQFHFHYYQTVISKQISSCVLFNIHEPISWITTETQKFLFVMTMSPPRLDIISKVSLKSNQKQPIHYVVAPKPLNATNTTCSFSFQSLA